MTHRERKHVKSSWISRKKSDNAKKKPWGYEYLAYENQKVALWLLYIKPNHQTSMHCHPLKTTGLTLLDGEAVN